MFCFDCLAKVNCILSVLSLTPFPLQVLQCDYVIAYECFYLFHTDPSFAGKERLQQQCLRQLWDRPQSSVFLPWPFDVFKTMDQTKMSEHLYIREDKTEHAPKKDEEEMKGSVCVCFLNIHGKTRLLFLAMTTMPSNGLPVLVSECKYSCP